VIVRRLTGILVVACWVGVLSSAAAMPAVAQPDDEAFRVDLDERGDAEVSVTYAYDLTTEDEADAFEVISNDEATRTAFVDRFESRMRSVAERSENRTGREMSVGDGAVELERTDDTGVVTLSVRWEGLAAAEGDALTLGEPFASGFSPDRPLTVSAPDGYAIAATTPTASEDGASTATWDAGTDLGGFEVEMTAEGGTAGSDADGTGGTPTANGTEDTPGFSVGVAAVALLAAVLLGERR